MRKVLVETKLGNSGYLGFWCSDYVGTVIAETDTRVLVKRGGIFGSKEWLPKDGMYTRIKDIKLEDRELQDVRKVEISLSLDSFKKLIKACREIIDKRDLAKGDTISFHNQTSDTETIFKIE